MLKFLVDESSGTKLTDMLKTEGYDAIYAGEQFKGASDDELLKIAQYYKRILITNDKDFGEAIFRHKRVSSGVIFLRLKIDKPSNRAKYVIMLIKKFEEKLNKNFVTVTDDRLRIRQINS